MKTTNLAVLALVIAAVPLGGAATEKPRVFITESQSFQLSGNVTLPWRNAKGGISAVGGASPQSVEVMKTFLQRCPNVVVTANRDKTDYLVRLDHEPPNPNPLRPRK
jgi:hypothetical protein